MLGRGLVNDGSAPLLPWDDEDFADALLLHAFEWHPRGLEDIESQPDRVIRLLIAYRSGSNAKLNSEREPHGV